MSATGRDERLLRYLEGELSPSERNAVEAEIDDSPSARVLLAELQRIYGDATVVDDSEPPRDQELSGGDLTEGEALPAERPSHLAPSTRVGRYLVEAVIGTGAMGVVYRARDPALDREVALKLISPRHHDDRSAQRLIREAQALAQLSHPNVVGAFDVGTHEGSVFLAMELVRGSTLGQWLAQQPRSWQEIVRVFVAAGRGLVAAHEAGLVHRDFKPANVLVREDDQVLVTDFGLARGLVDVADSTGPGSDDIDQLRELETITETGAIMGTPAYMSPEQITGRPVGPASDQFSFCVALFEALFGKRPFKGSSFIELSEQITFAEVLPPLEIRTLPRGLWQAIARGLAKAPAQRWPSMEALVDELRACSRTPRRWPWAVGLGVLAVASVGLAVALRSPARTCPSEAELRAELWDDAREAQLRRAFAAGPEGSAARWDALRPRLRAHLDGWVAARGQVCREGIDEASLDARSSCLDRWERRTSTLLSALTEGGDDLADRAATAIAELPRAETCLDEGSDVEPWPEGEADRERVAQLRLALQEVTALGDGGRPQEALERARAVLTEAEALGYGPLEAEAKHALARALEDGGFPSEARAEYEAAYWLAQAFGHDQVMAESATFLVGVLADDLSRTDDAEGWLRHARSAVQRLGDRGVDVATALANHEGMIALRREDPDTAIERFTAALELVEGRLDHSSRSYAALQENLAMALMMDGRHEEALGRLRMLLEEREELLGPDHPSLGGLLAKIGGLYYYLEQPTEAIAHHRRALAIRERSLGAEHWRVGTTRHNLGLALAMDGRLEEASREQELALRILRAAQRPEHDDVLRLTFALADTQLALAHAQRTLELADELEQTLRGMSESPAEQWVRMYGLRMRAQAMRGDREAARQQLALARSRADGSEAAAEELRRVEAAASELDLGEPS